MAYVPVPKDLTKVKSKFLFNLTKRQVICFGLGALVGVPVFFLTKGIIGVSMAGGVFHNLGQLAVAILLVSGPQLIHYMTVLIISGMTAGIIVGIGALILTERLPARLFM